MARVAASARTDTTGLAAPTTDRVTQIQQRCGPTRHMPGVTAPVSAPYVQVAHP